MKSHSSAFVDDRARPHRDNNRQTVVTAMLLQVVVLATISVLTTSCIGANDPPETRYRRCLDVCSNQFNTCLRGCPVSRMEQCERKLKKCTERCKKKFKVE